jgi:uncharacterized membrane protein
MKLLKMLLLIIGIIIAIPLVLALFIKKDYVVKKEIIINKPSNDVYNYVRYIKNQEHYSKWVMADPAMKKAFTGSDGDTGFIYAWESENKQVGKGEQEIKKLVDNKEVDCEVRFEKPMRNTAQISMVLQEAPGEKTHVSWAMLGENKYPLNFMNLFIPALLGKDLEQSLQNLKGILEVKNN